MTERLRTRIEEVTSRQLEVARLVAEGRTNPEIATSLGITLDGAKYHVSELLGRLGLERREEIAEWYRAERGAHRRRRLLAGLFASAPRAFATAAGATALLAVGAMVAIGLSGGRVDEDSLNTASPTPSPVATQIAEAGGTPPVGTSGDASDLPAQLQGLPSLLGQRLKSPAPRVTSWERVDWLDGCFDLDPPGGCPLSVSPVPGYRVVLDLDGARYVARTDLEATRHALEEAPSIAPFDVAFEWQGLASIDYFQCLHLRLGWDGTGTVGLCGEAPTPVDVRQSSVGSTGFLEAMAEHLPASLQSTATGRTSFGGGRERALYEWGWYLALELHTGHSSASIALAVSWRDEEAEGCANVQVEHFGAAYLSGCPEAGDRVVFLDDDQLSRLYGWLDTYQPFELTADSAYLTFSGSGGVPAPEEVRREIIDWLRLQSRAPATAAE